MKVAGDSSLPAPPERAYALLHDPAILAKCIPGCEGLDRVGEDDYAMRMKIGIAAISGRFDGKVRIADQKPPTSFRLIVEGSGKIGFMKGDGTIALSPADGGSNVQFEGDVQVGGTIANVGQRLIEGTAKMIIRRFFDKLAEEATETTHA
jgi:uncharacterized protein